MAYHIKQLLDNVLPIESDWKRNLLANWSKTIGNLYSKVTIEQIYEDSLVLGVYDSCWLQELYMLSSILIKQINATLDSPRIKQIRFKLIGSGIMNNRATEKKERPLFKNIELNAKEKEALLLISDPGLQKVLTSYRIRCHQEQ